MFAFPNTLAIFECLLDGCIMTDKFGQRIKTIREEKGYSQRGLARKAGMSGPSLWAIEHGRTKTIQMDTLMALAEALGTNVIYLSTGDGEKKPFGATINEIVKRLAEMPPEKQQMILAMIRASEAQ